jgi:hypothetical protein
MRRGVQRLLSLKKPELADLALLSVASLQPESGC